MTTFEPGTPVWHPEHGYGFSYCGNASNVTYINYLNRDGKPDVTHNLDGWERARIAGPGEVIVKVGDINPVALHNWAVVDDRKALSEKDELVIRAAKAWAELHETPELKTEQPATVGDGCECGITPEHMWTTYGSSIEPGSQIDPNPWCPKHGNPPKRVKDRERDVWTLRENGKYTIFRHKGSKSLAELERAFGPLTALDDGPATSLGQGNPITFLAVDETSPVGHYVQHDSVNNLSHYTSSPATCECGKSIECIQITEHMGFNLGNAVKYVWRSDLKGDAVEDLRKAVWYLNREIRKRTR